MYFGGVHAAAQTVEGLVGLGDARRDGFAIVVRGD